MRSNRSQRPFAALLLAAGLSACDSHSTLPGPPPVLAPPPEVEVYLPSIADAGERITPGLSDTKTGAKIGAELTLLDRHLRQRDAARARNALQSLRDLIAQYAPAARVPDGAELSAIELVLDAAQSLLSEPAR